MKNKPQTVEEIVRGFENDFRDYLDASILHYEVSGRPLSSEDEIEWLTKKVNGLITQDRLAHKTAMLEAIEGEKDRIDCCKTTCFSCEDSRFRNRTLDTMTAIINKIYE